MKKGEASGSGRFDPVSRLTALLRKILNDVDQSVKVLKEAVDGSQLPYIQGGDGDIKLAAMYLRDLGLPNDGKRLQGEYWQLCNKCIDEWLSGMADGESQELDREQLTELFGQFPGREGPNDPNVAGRKVAILGLAVQFSDYLSGLIRAVEPSETPGNIGTSEHGSHRAASTTPAADPPNPERLLEKCKPSERQAYFSFKLAEAKAERRLEDQEAYDRLKEVNWTVDSIGVLADYKLPGFPTWARQLREARKATNERKYTPRTHK